ncbi:hypothetical protein BT96DRAFT_951417 [Gymnopus androsaceus JB14]|uniref:Uncharacterized protein n=1 Tax=Gymnopus androsaceus JB14 TaxID=1447944 RepID=A0A6A4GCV4_9AGAR|nr:hypothetical protein BT96DRAFT_951417 [Gymnopus androsaceus JB14]
MYSVNFTIKMQEVLYIAGKLPNVRSLTYIVLRFLFDKPPLITIMQGPPGGPGRGFRGPGGGPGFGGGPGGPGGGFRGPGGGPEFGGAPGGPGGGFGGPGGVPGFGGGPGGPGGGFGGPGGLGHHHPGFGGPLEDIIMVLEEDQAIILGLEVPVGHLDLEDSVGPVDPHHREEDFWVICCTITITIHLYFLMYPIPLDTTIAIIHLVLGVPQEVCGE